jgi:hypothetical protein
MPYQYERRQLFSNIAALEEILVHKNLYLQLYFLAAIASKALINNAFPKSIRAMDLIFYGISDLTYSAPEAVSVKIFALMAPEY